MPFNHADGTMFVSVIFYPIAAGVGAARAGAGWLTCLFIPVGLAVGIGIIWLGRKLVYVVADFGLSRTSKMPRKWLQQICAVPFFLLYVILPYAIVWGGVFGVWCGCSWLARHMA